jgi:chaperonin GroES
MAENTKISPLGDRVVIRPLTDEEAGTVSAAGIIIPETVDKEKPEQGVIIAVGKGKLAEDGKTRIALEVKEGDRVVFSKYGYDEVKIGGQDYYVVSESNILGIIN